MVYYKSLYNMDSIIPYIPQNIQLCTLNGSYIPYNIP